MTKFTTMQLIAYSMRQTLLARSRCIWQKSHRLCESTKHMAACDIIIKTTGQDDNLGGRTRIFAISHQPANTSDHPTRKSSGKQNPKSRSAWLDLGPSTSNHGSIVLSKASVVLKGILLFNQFVGEPHRIAAMYGSEFMNMMRAASQHRKRWPNCRYKESNPASTRQPSGKE